MKYLGQLIEADRVVLQGVIVEYNKSAERQAQRNDFYNVHVFCFKHADALAYQKAQESANEMYEGQGEVRKPGLVDRLVEEYDAD